MIEMSVHDGLEQQRGYAHEDHVQRCPLEVEIVTQQPLLVQRLELLTGQIEECVEERGGRLVAFQECAARVCNRDRVSPDEVDDSGAELCGDGLRAPVTQRLPKCLG